MAEKYIKTDPISHILMRPDTYVGSKSFRSSVEYVYANEKLVKKTIKHSPALTRTFVEILANAVDNSIRHPGCKSIKITLSSDQCSIYNDGNVIPIEKNESEPTMYNHELIFGHLLTSSNYDDTKERFVSGRNGYGAKLTNVFSTEFTVEGVDPVNKLKLVQTWTNNMKETTGPIVTKSTRKIGYTMITWKPDFSQFGIDEYPTSTMELFGKCCVDAALNVTATVSFNDVKLPNTLAKYCLLMSNSNTVDTLKLSSDTCSVIVSPAEEFEAISFVNGIMTKNGGKHVDAWVEAVCKPVVKKLKMGTVKDVKCRLKFIIVTSVANPEFESQEKNSLESPNIKAEPITNAQVTKILTKWGLGNEIKGQLESREKSKIAKTVMAKRSTVVVPGYDKANNCGVKKGKDCSLIVCEGLSAKTFAVAGIKCGMFGKKGRDWFGIYPLRGKILNVRKATPKSIGDNEVIKNLIRILGLNYSEPDNLEKLNYGKVCIIVDADVDGIHIKGLLINFFHHLFPSLLTNGTIVCMNTPILRIGRTFYYDERTANDVLEKTKKRETVKYYKGLGTTKPEEVKEIFGVKMTEYTTDDDTTLSLEMAFGKGEASLRKKWVCNYDPLVKTTTLDSTTEKWTTFTISEFVSDDLVKFSYDDCKRSIPSVYDGLKESQRKILYAAKKKNLVTEIKVAQFGGYVSEHTNYHHGEQNLFDTIIKMAQTFPGSNNIPYFTQGGMFGTALSGGKDASSARYIYTKLEKTTNIIFPRSDEMFIKNRIDDNDEVEPYYYVPIIPMLLINGCMGIGTGWQCSVPCFSKMDVIENVRNYIHGREINELVPYYNGFNGTISKTENNKFETKGTYTKQKPGEYIVTQLPVGLWNDKFKAWCEDTKDILDIKDNSDTVNVKFTLLTAPTFDEEKLDSVLTTTLNTNNIVAFDKTEKLCKMSVNGIFMEWGSERRAIYEMRKKRDLDKYVKEIGRVRSKITFIDLVRSKHLDLTLEETTVIDIMKANGIINDDIINEILRLPMRTLTLENKKQLEKTLTMLLQEKHDLEHTTINQMWERELDMIN